MNKETLKKIAFEARDQKSLEHAKEILEKIVYPRMLERAKSGSFQLNHNLQWKEFPPSADIPAGYIMTQIERELNSKGLRCSVNEPGHLDDYAYNLYVSWE